MDVTSSRRHYRTGRGHRRLTYGEWDGNQAYVTPMSATPSSGRRHLRIACVSRTGAADEADRSFETWDASRAGQCDRRPQVRLHVNNLKERAGTRPGTMAYFINRT